MKKIKQYCLDQATIKRIEKLKRCYKKDTDYILNMAIDNLCEKLGENMEGCRRICLNTTHWYKIGQLKQELGKDSADELIAYAIERLWKEAKLM